MSLRIPTLTTAAMLGALLVLGPLSPAQAGDGEGCTKDKKAAQTSTHWGPVAAPSIVEIGA